MGKSLRCAVLLFLFNRPGGKKVDTKCQLLGIARTNCVRTPSPNLVLPAIRLFQLLNLLATFQKDKRDTYAGPTIPPSHRFFLLPPHESELSPAVAHAMYVCDRPRRLTYLTTYQIVFKNHLAD